MMEHKSTLNGTFDDQCVENSIPYFLLQFVCIIEHGVDIKSQLKFGASKIDLSMSQLLQYNCYAKQKEESKIHQHSKDRETQFPVFLGMSVYLKTRKKQLIEMLHELGLSIPYNRVLEVSAQLGDAAVSKYKAEGIVCPNILRKYLFTTAAMDNINHNPTATTATTSFHGTSISIFQHPIVGNEGEQQEPNRIDTKVNKIQELPGSYTNVRPAFFTQKNPEPPPTQINLVLPNLVLKEEFEWLHKVSLTETIDTTEVDITWSSYHGAMKRSPDFQVSVTSLLPLFREQAHSVATICHCLDKVKEVVSYFHPHQVSVIAADQPIFATAKQVQWHWPDKYGENKFIIMFGGLHIEMAALKSMGTLLQDSGWTAALTESAITTAGTAESFLRTRQIHQVTVSSLYKLLTEAYDIHYVDAIGDGQPFPDFDGWCSRKESP